MSFTFTIRFDDFDALISPWDFGQLLEHGQLHAGMLFQQLFDAPGNIG